MKEKLNSKLQNTPINFKAKTQIYIYTHTNTLTLVQEQL